MATAELLTDATLSIADAARATGVSPHTLRYYERTGLMIDAVARAPSSHRRYSEDEIRWVIVLTRLRGTGMPIRRMREYADMVREGRGNEAARLALLVAHRAEVQARLDEVAHHLEALDAKIAVYRDDLASCD